MTLQFAENKPAPPPPPPPPPQDPGWGQTVIRDGGGKIQTKKSQTTRKT